MGFYAAFTDQCSSGGMRNNYESSNRNNQNKNIEFIGPINKRQNSCSGRCFLSSESDNRFRFNWQQVLYSTLIGAQSEHLHIYHAVYLHPQIQIGSSGGQMDGIFIGTITRYGSSADESGRKIEIVWLDFQRELQHLLLVKVCNIKGVCFALSLVHNMITVITTEWGVNGTEWVRVVRWEKGPLKTMSFPSTFWPIIFVWTGNNHIHPLSLPLRSLQLDLLLFEVD